MLASLASSFFSLRSKLKKSSTLAMLVNDVPTVKERSRVYLPAQQLRSRVIFPTIRCFLSLTFPTVGCVTPHNYFPDFVQFGLTKR